MPYVWTEPDSFITHQGVEVYHVYKRQLALTYWYTTNPCDDDGDCPLDGDDAGQFDVRDLPRRTPEEIKDFIQTNGLRPHNALEANHMTRIGLAIEEGISLRKVS